MDYLTIKEISKLWGVSPRSVQEMCKSNKIEGAIKFGRDWAIPKDAKKPGDQRIKSGKYIKSKI